MARGPAQLSPQGEPRDRDANVAAGYSGTPLLQKLGIKPRHRVYVAGPGVDLGLPGDVTVLKTARPFDVAVLFVRSRAEFEKRFATALRALPADGAVWIAWPKKASKVPTDMTDHIVREVALPLGLVDNKVCAIDDVWTGLRVVVRRERRPGWSGG